MKQKYLVGIDLGTSYSALSCVDAHFEARSVANKEGEFKTPSAVYFAKGGGGLIVGSNALASGHNNPERFVSHAKRFLGIVGGGEARIRQVFGPEDGAPR